MKSATNKWVASAAAHDPDILHLRISGLSYRAIAQKLGINHMAVSRALHRILSEARVERLKLADELIELELERLDAIIADAGGLINAMRESGQIDRIAPLLRVQLQAVADRVKVQGLAAPEKHEVTVTHEQALAELE